MDDATSYGASYGYNTGSPLYAFAKGVSQSTPKAETRRAPCKLPARCSRQYESDGVPIADNAHVEIERNVRELQQLAIKPSHRFRQSGPGRVASNRQHHSSEYSEPESAGDTYTSGWKR